MKQTDSKAGEFSLSFDYDAMGHRIAKHSYDKDGSANGGIGNLVKSTYYILDAQGNTMSIYERTVDAIAKSVTYEQADRHIYGSSRVGVMNVYNNTQLHPDENRPEGYQGVVVGVDMKAVMNVIKRIQPKVLLYSTENNIDEMQSQKQSPNYDIQLH